MLEILWPAAVDGEAYQIVRPETDEVLYSGHFLGACRTHTVESIDPEPLSGEEFDALVGADSIAAGEDQGILQILEMQAAGKCYNCGADVGMGDNCLPCGHHAQREHLEAIRRALITCEERLASPTLALGEKEDTMALALSEIGAIVENAVRRGF